jgi:hypothetical protein
MANTVAPGNSFFHFQNAAIALLPPEGDRIVIPAGISIQNNRYSRFSTRHISDNVFARANTSSIGFELYRNVDRVGFFPDSLFTASRTVSTFQTPLYQRDPDNRLSGAFFRLSH